MPMVSVIIPAYNTAPYLRRCLDSMVNQTLRDIEIICINDCSTDDTLAVLNEYAARDERVKVIDSVVNEGETCSRNKGLAIATGEYLGFVDSDDYVDCDFFEKLWRRIDRKPDIIKANCCRTDETGKITIDAENLNAAIRNNRMYFASCFWTAIYRAALIRDNQIRFLPGIPNGGDLTFLIQAVCCANNVATIDDVYYHYIRRNDSMDARVKGECEIRSILQARNYIVDYINAAHLPRDDYLIVFAHQFYALIGLINITHEQKSRILISASLCKFYRECRYPEWAVNEFNDLLPFLGTDDGGAGLLIALREKEKRRLFAALKSKRKKL